MKKTYRFLHRVIVRSNKVIKKVSPNLKPEERQILEGCLKWVIREAEDGKAIVTKGCEWFAKGEFEKAEIARRSLKSDKTTYKCVHAVYECFKALESMGADKDRIDQARDIFRNL